MRMKVNIIFYIAYCAPSSSFVLETVSGSEEHSPDRERVRVEYIEEVEGGEEIVKPDADDSGEEGEEGEEIYQNQEVSVEIEEEVDLDLDNEERFLSNFEDEGEPRSA